MMRTKVISIRIKALRNRRIVDAYKSQMNNQPTRGTIIDITDIEPQDVVELSGPVKAKKPMKRTLSPQYFANGGSGLTIGDRRIVVMPNQYMKGVDKPVDPPAQNDGANEFKERVDVFIQINKQNDNDND